MVWVWGILVMETMGVERIVHPAVRCSDSKGDKLELSGRTEEQGRRRRVRFGRDISGRVAAALVALTPCVGVFFFVFQH